MPSSWRASVRVRRSRVVTRTRCARDRSALRCTALARWLACLLVSARQQSSTPTTPAACCDRHARRTNRGPGPRTWPDSHVRCSCRPGALPAPLLPPLQPCRSSGRGQRPSLLALAPADGMPLRLATQTRVLPAASQPHRRPARCRASPSATFCGRVLDGRRPCRRRCNSARPRWPHAQRPPPLPPPSHRRPRRRRRRCRRRGHAHRRCWT